MSAEHEPKPASSSHVTLTQLMEVTDANVAGNVHGGVVMRLADTAAALAAIRHAEGLCVTVSVDEVSFLEPVHVGDVLTFAPRSTTSARRHSSAVSGSRRRIRSPGAPSMRRPPTSCSWRWTPMAILGAIRAVLPDAFVQLRIAADHDISSMVATRILCVAHED